MLNISISSAGNGVSGPPDFKDFPFNLNADLESSIG